ncbi:MAG: replication protein [Clostridium sp.]|nr:replication protein [Clostridium sp.]
MNKKMLISSNYSLEKLSKTYSERITSRLFGNFKLFKFYGEDIRVKINFSRQK